MSGILGVLAATGGSAATFSMVTGQYNSGGKAAIIYTGYYPALSIGSWIPTAYSGATILGFYTTSNDLKLSIRVTGIQISGFISMIYLNGAFVDTAVYTSNDGTNSLFMSSGTSITLNNATGYTVGLG